MHKENPLFGPRKHVKYSANQVDKFCEIPKPQKPLLHPHPNATTFNAATKAAVMKYYPSLAQTPEQRKALLKANKISSKAYKKMTGK